MSMYATLKDRYDKGFCRADQLDRYVALGKLTEQERQDILGGVEPEQPSGDAEAMEQALNILGVQTQ